MAFHRASKSREEILRILTKMSAPVSAREIIEKISTVDRATIYRELSFLKSQGAIREVSLGENKARYELEDSHCHHHLVCDNCGKITDIILDEEKILSQIPSSKDFHVKRHSIEFFGLCSNCH